MICNVRKRKGKEELRVAKELHRSATKGNGIGVNSIALTSASDRACVA